MDDHIAWIGPMPSEGGGVAFMATQMLVALPGAGIGVDCFVAGRADAVPGALRGIDGLAVAAREPAWQPDRWYSSARLTKLVTGQLARARAQNALLEEVAERHVRRPYRALYQFSQIELFAIRRMRDRLPPVIVHPEVHAAGELRWHVRERGLARAAGEHPAQTLGVIALFAARAAAQARDLHRVDRVVAPSAAFAGHLAHDYRLPRARISVVPNPIDLQTFHPPPAPRPLAGRPVELLFVSRISTRKGIELLIDLSHRLRDLAGDVRLTLLGGESLWSDYRPLLDGLAPEVARYAGAAWPHDMAAAYHEADALLQPSHYEPFALTVGEALAAGLPVVVSDEVGAGERVDPRCCRRFAAGSVAALERAVRDLVADLRRGRACELRAAARLEAERLFAPSVVAAQLAEVIREVRR